MQQIIRIEINRRWCDFSVGHAPRTGCGHDLDPTTTLARLLRDRLGLTGLKVACDEGACGACTVLMDGKAVLSCMTLAVEADGHSVTTVEGLAADDPVITAFAEQSEPGYGSAMQCGYCSPGFVMAAKGLLNENPNPTREEVEEGLAGNICRCGCYPAIVQAVLRAAEKINGTEKMSTREGFQPRKPRKYIGQYRPRLADGLAKASGKAQYLDDIAIPAHFPGMLYAKVLTSPYPHARIKSIDVSRAQALPGVHTILTYDDEEIKAFKPTSHAWTSIITTQRARWTTVKYNDRRVLSDHFCAFGEKNGVVVAAESEEIAEEALKLLDIDWEVLPFVIDPQEALKPGSYPIHPEMNPQGNELPADPRLPGEPVIELDPRVNKPVFLDRGDVEKGMAEADVIHEQTTAYHRADHGTLDSMGCLMVWEGDQLICYTNSYQADQTRMMIATMMEMPINKVRVICPYVGASMGRWNVGDQTFYLFTALLAKRSGRPVRYKHTRREDFHDTRLQITWTGKFGAKKDGTITTASFNGLADVGAYGQHVGLILKYIPLEISARLLAHIPNLRMEGHGVYTNKIPGGMMRCTGNIQLNLMLGTLLDGLADKLGLDPVDVAVRNFGNAWKAVPNPDLEAVLHAGARRVGWESRHAAGKGELIDGHKRRGMGFSLHMGWHAEWEEDLRGRNQVGVKVNPDLSVILLAPTVETGTGSNNAILYACAESLSFLGITPPDIRWVALVDTETGFKDCVQTDSAVSYLQPELLPEVAAQVKKEVLERAAAYFQAGVKEMDVDEGRVFFKADPSKNIPVNELLLAGDNVPILVTVSRLPNTEKTGVPYMACFAEVEVDTDTGMVEIVQLIIVNDCGTVMYATGAEAQQIGGQLIGIGETLTEEIIYDPVTGVPLNFNWVDYKILTPLDFPTVMPVLLEVWRGAGEYGACGIGESIFTCTPAAILNAVHNATGARMERIPLHPRDILRALEK